MFLYPLLKYTYSLEYDDKPDYEYIRFMFTKIILDHGFLPDQKFDWSFEDGGDYQMIDDEDRHSSISSCDVSENEDPDNEEMIPGDR